MAGPDGSAGTTSTWPCSNKGEALPSPGSLAIRLGRFGVLAKTWFWMPASSSKALMRWMHWVSLPGGLVCRNAPIVGSTQRGLALRCLGLRCLCENLRMWTIYYDQQRRDLLV